MSWSGRRTIYDAIGTPIAGHLLSDLYDKTMRSTKRRTRSALAVFHVLVYLVSTGTRTFGATDDEAAFFQINRERYPKDLVELPSGLQYRILTNGTGVFHPQPMCQCLCHYEGRLIDGHVFDSSLERGEPLRVAPSQVIDGWAEAMHRMVQGDKWELFVPSELGYGERGHPPDIPGHAVLIFTLEMVEIDCEQKVPALKCQVATGELCSERELGYMAKIKTWTAEKIANELMRLSKILDEGTPIREDLREWVIRREYLLKHFLAEATTSSEDEL